MALTQDQIVQQYGGAFTNGVYDPNANLTDAQGNYGMSPTDRMTSIIGAGIASGQSQADVAASLGMTPDALTSYMSSVYQNTDPNAMNYTSVDPSLQMASTLNQDAGLASANSGQPVQDATGLVPTPSYNLNGFVSQPTINNESLLNNAIQNATQSFEAAMGPITDANRPQYLAYLQSVEQGTTSGGQYSANGTYPTAAPGTFGNYTNGNYLGTPLIGAAPGATTSGGAPTGATTGAGGTPGSLPGGGSGVTGTTAGGAGGATPPGTGGGSTVPAATVNQWLNNYNAANGIAPTATQGYTAAQATATPWNMSADQTVSGNINALIDANSPLMQRAAATADASMNSRGLLSSSMATGAAQGAVMDRALPIAQQDAQTNAQNAQFNAGQSTNVDLANTQATNRAGEFTAGAANTGALADTSSRTSVGTALIGSEASHYASDTSAATQRFAASLGAQTQLAVADEQSKTQLGVAGISAQTQQSIATLDNANRLAITGLNNQNSLLINTNANATSVFNQTVAAVSTIQNNPAMDTTTKTTAVQSVIDMANSQLAVLGSVANLNLPPILDFTQPATPTTIDPTTGQPVAASPVPAPVDNSGSSGAAGSPQF